MKVLTVSRIVCSLALVALAAIMLASTVSRSRAHSQTINITVVNNSSSDIRRLFLSAPDSNVWSSDQFNNNPLSPGHSFTVNNVGCDQENVRTIAEDPNGCFIYQSVSCANDASVTVTDDSTRDCGN